MCGIGTTLVEAIRLGRHAIGTEYVPRWAALAGANVRHITTTAGGQGEVHYGDACCLTTPSLQLPRGPGRRHGPGNPCRGADSGAGRQTHPQPTGGTAEESWPETGDRGGGRAAPRRLQAPAHAPTTTGGAGDGPPDRELGRQAGRRLHQRR
ncbi:hypothetical protein ABZ468_49670 [Streptomyces sp. NPDC005708]|uniref:hypothetical protein n=1 Tax=Streptomyces sp. NPDC005708 TaxID=3154564 RepID=UPI0033CB5FBA